MPSTAYKWFLRMVTYGTSAVLAMLLLTAAIPPLFSTTTGRAVVNAPVIAVTAPITGTVSAWRASEGDMVKMGELIGSVHNSRAERSTLTQIHIKLADVEARISNADEQVRQTSKAIKTITDRIAAKREAHVALLESRLAAEESRRDAQLSEMRLAEIVLHRQKQLIDKDFVSQSRVDEDHSLLEQARRNYRALSSELTVTRTLLSAAREGVFVGDELDDLVALELKLDDLTLALSTARQTARVAAHHHSELSSLAREEQARLDAIVHSDIVSQYRGRMLSVVATEGRDVRVGETLAHAVDCGARRIVAIFPQRHAQDLYPGRRALIRSDAWPTPRHSVIERVFPHNSDFVDSKFAVPFPPIERRELYAVLTFEQIAYDDTAEADCGVGLWVEVSVGAGLVPGMVETATAMVSQAWRSLAALRSPSPLPPAENPFSADAGSSAAPSPEPDQRTAPSRPAMTEPGASQRPPSDAT